MHRVLGPENEYTLECMGNLAITLAHEKRYREAEDLAHQLHDTRLRVVGPTNPATAFATYILASITARTGHRDSAVSLLRDAVDHGLSADHDLEIENNPDFKSLHGEPRFTKIVADAKQHADATQKPPAK